MIIDARNKPVVPPLRKPDKPVVTEKPGDKSLQLPNTALTARQQFDALFKE
jgi:hypothetical protein